MGSGNFYTEAMRRSGHPLVLVKSAGSPKSKGKPRQSYDDATAVNDASAIGPELGNERRAIKSSARASILIGYAVIGLLLIGVGGWAVTAPISSAAIAPGIVTVEGNRKTVQHLEGGIVRRILVHDGATVVTNQLLVELEDTRTRAEHDSLLTQQFILASRVSRLGSEFKRDDRIHFSDALRQKSDDPIAALAMAGEQQIFNARRAMFKDSTGVMRQRIAQLELEIGGLQDHLTAREEQLTLVSKELKVFEKFLADGLIPRDRLFDLEKEQASLKASRSEAAADIASTRGKLIELQQKAGEADLIHSVEAAQELALAQQELAEVEHKLSVAGDALNRTVIRAPIGGVVINMSLHTVGGVVAGGDPLLDIVPENARLIVTARVDPKDRDAVKVGQTAEVRFSAFNRRTTIPVRGEVMTISADSVVEAQRADAGHYVTRVSLLDDPDGLLSSRLVHPGMQADVLIMTGSRTLMSYLFKPILRSVNRAMRED